MFDKPAIPIFLNPVRGDHSRGYTSVPPPYYSEALMSKDLLRAVFEMFDHHVKLVKEDKAPGQVVFAGVQASRQRIPGILQCIVILLPVERVDGMSPNVDFDWQHDREVFQLTNVDRIGVSDVLFLGQGSFGYKTYATDRHCKKVPDHSVRGLVRSVP